ncbi:Low affinity iron permease-domain-containing protein [Xylariaceae sp. FL0016]|nr:Low affinity iron permease-domain-containing protein [Xylariaceae sp. FL0016]
MCKSFLQKLREAPKEQYNTSAAAFTQIPDPVLAAPAKAYVDEKSGISVEATAIPTSALPVRVEKEKRSPLDIAVDAAGSRWTLAITLALLVAWGIWGAVDGPEDTWQVILQDVSSIQAYISATLLMRQQATSCRRVLGRICTLISRSKSNERMLGSISEKQRDQLRLSTHKVRADVMALTQNKEDWLDRLSNSIAAGVGSLVFLGIYVMGIIVWAAMGPSLQFSDTWQLDVNTATALEITFTTVFLQNIRKQHERHLDKVIQAIETVDRDVEMKLRQMTGDTEMNQTVHSTPAQLNRWTTGIDMWAYIMGGNIGVLLSVIVFSVWIAVGSPLGFSDNWFLIIGTYTGLMGFIDGFTMKNVDHRESALAERHFQRLEDQDHNVFRLLDVEMPVSQQKTKQSLNLRISNAFGHYCGTTAASYGAFATVVTLIVIASAMQWTETGQLLCNTPTMIIEGLLLITLLQAHNTEDDRKRALYGDVLQRRLALDTHLAAWDAPAYVLPEVFTGEKGPLVPGLVVPPAYARGSLVIPREKYQARQTAFW